MDCGSGSDFLVPVTRHSSSHYACTTPAHVRCTRTISTSCVLHLRLVPSLAFRFHTVRTRFTHPLYTYLTLHGFTYTPHTAHLTYVLGFTSLYTFAAVLVTRYLPFGFADLTLRTYLQRTTPSPHTATRTTHTAHTASARLPAHWVPVLPALFWFPVRPCAFTTHLHLDCWFTPRYTFLLPVAFCLFACRIMVRLLLPLPRSLTARSLRCITHCVHRLTLHVCYLCVTRCHTHLHCSLPFTRFKHTFCVYAALHCSYATRSAFVLPAVTTVRAAVVRLSSHITFGYRTFWVALHVTISYV